MKIHIVCILPHKMYVCDVVAPCVRVCCGLYHLGCVYLWHTCPMRESPLRTVPPGLCVSVIYLSHVWESAADCTTWAVCVCGVLAPCVTVRCGLYHMGCVCLWCTCPMRDCPLRTVPHGLTVLLFWFSPLCESLLRTVSTCRVFFPLCEHVVRYACFLGKIHHSLSWMISLKVCFTQTLAWLYYGY